MPVFIHIPPVFRINILYLRMAYSIIISNHSELDFESCRDQNNIRWYWIPAKGETFSTYTQFSSFANCYSIHSFNEKKESSNTHTHIVFDIHSLGVLCNVRTMKQVKLNFDSIMRRTTIWNRQHDSNISFVFFLLLSKLVTFSTFLRTTHYILISSNTWIENRDRYNNRISIIDLKLMNQKSVRFIQMQTSTAK